MVKTYTLKIIYLFMFALLIVRLIPSKAQPPYCTMERRDTEYFNCVDSLKLGTPWVPPSKDCCEYIQIDNMACFCKGANRLFSALFDQNKLFKISHACGDLLVPGSYCGIFKVPGGV
ncbi:hypothetical protein BRARA_A02623 [Brassica rapa]|uniref:Bifunctional inhibitor/plant lipid transfer protein/seed storage helical domain-containing protein n=3 Tax=Brassica TaxID=3705 RepID=A0A398AW95_BRACM|nr:hypothetical protein HID58_002740 [Brassica napus]RID79920.1 hypothetical protein BRARA_A02623 [Brassica rapa]CAF2153217.1 unnamed protein product [Brassica napus]